MNEVQGIPLEWMQGQCANCLMLLHRRGGKLHISDERTGEVLLVWNPQTGEVDGLEQPVEGWHTVLVMALERRGEVRPLQQAALPF